MKKEQKKSKSETDYWGHGYQPRRGGQSHKRMLAEKEEQKTTALKYSNVVPHVGKHTNEVIKVFKKLNVNAGIRNKAAIVNRISNDQTDNRKKANQSGVYKINCGQLSVSTLRVLGGSSEH